MKKRDSIFDEGKNTIGFIIGLDCLLLACIIFIAPFSSFFSGLAYISSFIWGFAGHCFILPFCILFCIERMIGYKKKKGSFYQKFKVFYFHFICGLSFLITDTALNGTETLEVTTFLNVLNNLNENGILAFEPQLGGGIFVYILSGLMTEYVGRWLTITVAIFLMTLATIVLFIDQIEIFFSFLKKKIVMSKESRELQKREKLELEKKQNFQVDDFQQHLFEDTFGNVPKIEIGDEDNVTETRYERNHLRRISEPEVSKVDDKKHSTVASEGLTPAIFGDTLEPAKLDEPNEPIEEIKAEDSFELAKPDFEDFDDNLEEEKETPEAIKEDNDFGFNESSIEEETETTSSTEDIPQEEIEESTDNLTPYMREILKVHPKAKEREPYNLPGIDLLDPIVRNDNNDLVEAACLENESKINDKLKSLGVGAYVVSHTIGPSVTRYNIKTHDDVMVNSVQRCISDLSIKLGGVPIRFEKLVRGSETSGLEVVNPVTNFVFFREVFSDLPVGPKYSMYFPFGKSIEGKTLCADLTDFPHMLVAGATGSGKSIFLHQVILPLIMRNRPEDLKLLLIDPKHIEMGKYREIGHLLCPVVTDPIKARVALEKLAIEMERRYVVLDNAGGIDVHEFNATYSVEHGLEKMPFIVVVIDEFADLVESNRNISELVLKIAAKARAAGIDLIVATQRPDVSVISGTIKANLQTRVALSMSSATDSQTIIGHAGAEDLNGKGDMLIDCGQIAKVGLTRCQGAIVTKDEIKRVTDAIRSQYAVQYDPAFLDLTDHSAEAESTSDPASIPNGDSNNFYELVKSFIKGRDYASASSIQREFSIGYPRAGKMIDMLAKEGIIGGENHPGNTAKGRIVLVHTESTETPSNGSVSQTYVIPEGFPQPGDK